ncbi:hypothetical protein [Streptomyces sp. 184]|uniref:hypothetical protein n=1 Tax=Streptomyces sp. 184 TaxID=1827526 RepID=UPI003891F901
MSAAEAGGGEPAGDGPPKPGKGAKPAKDEQRAAAETEEADDRPEEEQERPQDAWSARRDLLQHGPPAIGHSARFGGSFVVGDQIGMSGGRARDIYMGGKTEIYHVGVSTAGHASGKVSAPVLERMAERFVTDEDHFALLEKQLRGERVLILSGPPFTGRRTAAVMLLQRLGLTSVRLLDKDTAPARLAEQLKRPDGHAADEPCGYVWCDAVTSRDQPLRESHLLAAQERLGDGYLVATVAPSAVLEDVPAVPWQPPAGAEVLAKHLCLRVGEDEAHRMMSLPHVVDFLGRDHQLREVAAFAVALDRHSRGRAGEADVTGFSLSAIESQVREWFEAPSISLHDKAFLVALAAFDAGPYALTAELADVLYQQLQAVEDSHRPVRIPVFSPPAAERLGVLRAEPYEAEDETEWGPVVLTKGRYRDDRTAPVVLRQVWTAHPSARPALVGWLSRLARDGRPFVRSRAAAVTAVFAARDFPSAMALIVEPWTLADDFRRKLAAAGALLYAYGIGVPNVVRVLDAWCEDDSEDKRWVAIRTHALIGPARPRETLRSLRKAARRLHRELVELGERQDPADPEVFDEPPPFALLRDELADAVELLLTSDARGVVLAELRQTPESERAVRDMGVGGFVGACRRVGDESDGAASDAQPQVLAWYADAMATGSEDAAGIADLWRCALNSRSYGREALDVFRDWVLAADRAEPTEWALAALLPALVTTGREHDRLSHLLRTMPGDDGTLPPPVAARLLSVLSRHW